jgi:hypothetical protein
VFVPTPNGVVCVDKDIVVSWSVSVPGLSQALPALPQRGRFGRRQRLSEGCNVDRAGSRVPGRS